MQPSQYTSVGLTVATLTPIIMWATHWPLQPLTQDQASAIAGLLIAFSGGVHAFIKWKWPSKD